MIFVNYRMSAVKTKNLKIIKKFMEKELTICDIINELSQKVSLEGISKINWVNTLKEMYGKVSNLEKEKENLIRKLTDKEQETSNAKEELLKYSQEFVSPKLEFDKLKEELEKQKFEFEVEKKWIKLDRANLLEIVKMLTAKYSYSLYENSGNNVNKSESCCSEKPSLN